MERIIQTASIVEIEGRCLKSKAIGDGRFPLDKPFGGDERAARRNGAAPGINPDSHGARDGFENRSGARWRDKECA